MAENNKGAVKSGPLDLVQKGNFKKVKTYHSILMSTSKSGVARLELYENEDHSLTLQPFLMLVDKEVIKVEKLNYKGKENAFLISTKDHHYTFLTRNAVTCSVWVESIQNTLLLGAQGATSFQDSKNVTEKNNLYESKDGISPQNTEFIVKIHEDTKDKLHCKGAVKLKVENGSLIISSLPGKRLMDWSLTHIRRFGREDKNIFFLEAGRKSRLEGIFKFVTEQADGILLAMKTVQNKKETMDGPGHSPTSKAFNSAPQSLIAKMEPTQYTYDPVYEEFDMLPGANSSKPQGTQQKAAAQVPQSSLTSDEHKYQNTESGRPNCEPTYDDPVMITDAWKSNGRDEDSELYSTLTYCTAGPSKKQEEEEDEDHYWQGPMSQQHEEPLYAAVDHSKKKKKL